MGLSDHDELADYLAAGRYTPGEARAITFGWLLATSASPDIAVNRLWTAGRPGTVGLYDLDCSDSHDYATAYIRNV